MLKNSDQQILWEFIRGDLSSSEFERWLYHSDDFENAAGNDFYLEAISTNFNNISEVYLLKKNLEEFLRREWPLDCECLSLANLAITDEGSEYWRRVFNSLNCIQKYGQPRWWLTLHQCERCAQYWIVASEEFTYDVDLFKRLDTTTADKIIQKNEWPEYFQTLENVLAIGKINHRSGKFVDSVSPALETTIKNLKEDRPNISATEISSLLNIPEVQALELCRLIE